MSDPTTVSTPKDSGGSVEQLSGVAVVIIIAIAVQVFIVIFIFAKRQIMRFALRNKRGPHTHIGQGCPKTIRREIDRLLEYIPYIKHEPRVDMSAMNQEEKPKHYFRLKTIEQYRAFEYELACYSLNYSRALGTHPRSHLISCANGPLLGADTHLIHQICDDYEAARHHYEEYDQKHFQVFLQRLNSLKEILHRNKTQKPQPSPHPLSSSPKKTSTSAMCNQAL